MIKLTVLVRRNPSLSVDEFHSRWREHGQMISREPAFRAHIKRYEQHHAVPAEGLESENLDSEYDGMVLQWFDSYDDFLAFLRESRYKEVVRPDEEALLDMSKLVVFFTDEAETFIP